MKPILFNTEMVRAILEGRKTVTRRVVKPQPVYNPNDGFTWKGAAYGTDLPPTEKGATYNFRCAAPCRPGDILYVRETFFKYVGEYVYKASAAQPELWDGMWHPSIHMPREAARIFLRVTDVRLERLQDITDDGIVRDFNFFAEALKIMNAQQKDVACMALWNSTIKKADRALYGWDANPYVWRIDFERCEKPESD